MTRPLRIALISTVGTPVRRVGSDSIESHVWLLAQQLTSLGHEVTTYAAAGSEVHGTLVATLPGPYGTDGAPDDWQLCEWINLALAVADSDRFDVLHAHAYLWGMPLDRMSRAPMLHTLHIAPDDDAVRLWDLHPHCRVVSISDAQWSGRARHVPSATILHGVDLDELPFGPTADDYIVYLGRFTKDKGPDRAVAVARAIGIPIVLAGPRNEYFDEAIAPLVDGAMVRYAGTVAGAERAALLGRARALIYPVRYPEPFGLVLAEAMSCGTPVAAIGIGAVPEVVDQGVSGFHVEQEDDLPSATIAAVGLDRSLVRRQAEERFSGERMAREYDALYRSVVEA